MAFRVRPDEVQDLPLPLGEHWAGPVIGPPSVGHSPPPPQETGFASHMLDSNIIEHKSEYQGSRDRP